MYYTDEEIKGFGESIKESLLGFTKEEMEVFFEKYILPIYTFTARRPGEDTKYEVINRETKEIYKSVTTSDELFQIINS